VKAIHIHTNGERERDVAENEKENTEKKRHTERKRQT
jgi:hypothetical protein